MSYPSLSQPKMSYESAPPPEFKSKSLEPHIGINCLCCSFTFESKCDTKKRIVFFVGGWLIMSGVVSLILTASDPVFSLTYRFPNSKTDTIAHEWDCLSFGGLGVAFGILTIFCGFSFIKHGTNDDLCNSFGGVYALFWMAMIACSIVFTPLGIAMYARQNQVDDPDLSHDLAITSEGYVLSYQTRCGEYMNSYHPVGLVGAYFWAWSPLGAFVLCIILFALPYIFKCFRHFFICIFHVFVCNSVCPDLDNSLEKELKNCC